MMIFDDTTIKFIRGAVVIASLVLLAVGIFAGMVALNEMANSKRITDAQVENIKKQTEQIGKPIIYEQYYHSPQR